MPRRSHRLQGWFHRQKRARKGAILILGTFMMIVFCGFAAFAIDLGYIALTQAQLQNTADAAALAAVLELKASDGATREAIRQDALDEAIYAASLNRAGGRNVVLYPEDVVFGNRHYDVNTQQFETTLETDDDTLALNAIQVTISYDQKDTGPRRELDLWFARLIGKKTAAVNGFSRAQLTPRDLVFVIDISNSMNDDTSYDEMIRKWITDGANYPSNFKMNPVNIDQVASLDPHGTGDNTIWVRSANHGLRVGDFVTISGVRSPNDEANGYWEVDEVYVDGEFVTGDQSSSGLDWANNAWFHLKNSPALTGNYLGSNNDKWAIEVSTSHRTDGDYKSLWFHTRDTNGTMPGGTDQWVNANNFAADEFPANFFAAVPTMPSGRPLIDLTNYPQYPNGLPWMHWKWRAYCDWTFIGDPGGGGDYVYENVKNLNVLTCQRSRSSNIGRFGLNRYADFCITNGYVPSVKGQQVMGRDMDLDDDLDAADTDFGAVYGSDYDNAPTYAGYFGKPFFIQNFQLSDVDFDENSANGGLNVNNVPDQPISYVRQAALLGMYAMVSDENMGNDAFDQVGMITYGTRAWTEALLTNDVVEAVRLANSRVAVTGANLSIPQAANGNTNIGDAIRMALVQLDPAAPNSRARTFTDKTIALLTDGNPNISPSDAGPVTQENFNNSVSAGTQYALDMADAAAAQNVVIHTITVGNGANTTLMQNVADKTGGFYFRVDDPAAQQQELRNIFIAIGKDKLGKLYGQ